MKMLIHNTTSLYRPNILTFRFYKPHTDFTTPGVCLHNFQCFSGIKTTYWENGKVVILYI